MNVRYFMVPPEAGSMERRTSRAEIDILSRFSRGSSGSAGLGRSLRPADPVEHVRPQRMAGGDARVLEVVLRVVGHPDLLHHPPGAEVARHGEGDDLPEPWPLQGPAEAERLDGPFRRVAPVPERGREPPADLHAGREVRLEAGPGQPHPAD